MTLMNRDPNAQRDMVGFLHCAACVKDALANGIPPQIYARLEVGVTKDLRHMQIWCVRHDFSIAILELGGEMPPPACGGPHHGHRTVRES